MSFLKIQNLDISYKTRKETIIASQNVSFTLEKGEILGVLETRRHYTNYFKGIPNFKPYRTSMVTADDPKEVFDILNRILEEVVEPAWV